MSVGCLFTAIPQPGLKSPPLPPPPQVLLQRGLGPQSERLGVLSKGGEGGGVLERPRSSVRSVAERMGRKLRSDPPRA